MDTIWQSVWRDQTWGLRLFAVALFFVAGVTLARLVRLAWQLNRRSAPAISLDEAGKVAGDPEALAESALANRHCGTEFVLTSGLASDRSRVLNIMRTADSAFHCYWTKCSADVTAARRASALTLLLSLSMTTSGAEWMFLWCHEGSKATGNECMLQVLLAELNRFGFGLWFCIVLYALSSLFGRTLKNRRASWSHFVRVVTAGGDSCR